MLSCVSFPQHVITRGKKIGRIKCLLIRHSLFIFFWKVPRFKHKTDRECCRELSLLDGSSLGQSACGKSLRETRIVQNSQTITVSIHRFAYSYAFFLFFFFFILRTKGEKKENDVRNHVFGVLCPGVLKFFFFWLLGRVYIFFFFLHMVLHIFVVVCILNWWTALLPLSFLLFVCLCCVSLDFCFPYLGSVSDKTFYVFGYPSPFRMSLVTVLNYLAAWSNAPSW